MSAISFVECTTCRYRMYEAQSICPSCWGRSFVARESAGEGAVYTGTRVFVSLPDDRWAAIVPYDVVLVDVDEGFQVLGRGHLDVPPDALAGTRVRGHVEDGVPTFEKL